MAEPLTMALITELMPRLHAAFPRNLGKENPAMMAEVYRNGLRGLSGDAVRAAVGRAIQEDSYFPKVARIRELATAWERHNRPRLEPIVREAPWNVCPVCGAKAQARTISRKKRDPERGDAVVRDASGAVVWEDVTSQMLYIDHDPAKHHVVSRPDGAL